MFEKIYKLVYKKSIRVLYYPIGCYTICDGKLRYYKDLNALKNDIDVSIVEGVYGDNYWGSLKVKPGMEYGFIKNNTLYFVNKYGCLNDNQFNAYQINKFLNLKQFANEIKSGELINLNLNPLDEKLPDEKWKIKKLYKMIENVNGYLSSFDMSPHYKLKVDIRTQGEFEEKHIFTEKESGGQFTPFIRIWANNGRHTGLLKYKYFIEDMQVFLYRKMRKIGQLDEMLKERNISFITEKQTYGYFERVLRREGKIGRRSKIRIYDGIVCEYIVDFYFQLCNQSFLNNFIKNQSIGLIEQINKKGANYVKEVKMNSRAYDVIDDVDFGCIATAKVVDAYTCREATIRFVTSKNEDIESEFRLLKNDLKEGNIEFYILHYTDLVKKDMGFRQHIDTVLDDDGNKVSGYKNKAKQLKPRDRFCNFSVGVKGFVEATYNMEPKVFTLAAKLEEWNFLNDNVVTVRGIDCELRDFSSKKEELGVYPCVTVGLNLDEHSIAFGEVIELYYVNKRTNEYKCCVLCSSRVNSKSVKRKVINTEGMYGKVFSKTIA